MVSRVQNDSQTDKTSSSASSELPKSLKSSNSPEAKVQPTTNRSTKRKVQGEGKNSEKKKAKLQSSEMRTTLEYDGIGSCDSEVASVNKEEKILSNGIAFVTTSLTGIFHSSKLESIFTNTQPST